MANLPATLVVLTEKDLLKGKCGSLRAVSARHGEAFSSAASYFRDAKRPQVWYRRQNAPSYRELDTVSGNLGVAVLTSSSNVSVSVQIDELTGDIYALEQVSNLSSRILCRNAGTGWVTTIVLQSLSSDLSLANDMKLDSARRVMWIADSCKNRVLKVDMRTWRVIVEYVDTSFVFPCSLVVNPNSGDSFVRWYDADTRAEFISRLNSTGVQESYSATGAFF
jgi:hypothetical protein